MFALFSNWTKHNLISAFFLLTFIVAWSIWLPIGFLVPKFFVLAIIPGAWAPSIVSFYLTWLMDGKDGLRQFLKRVIHWRVGFKWYLIVFFSIVCIAYLAQGLNTWLFGGDPMALNLPAGIPEEDLFAAIPIIFIINIFLGGPLAEDIGWRGYALPKLREKLDALSASLIIGVVWVLWHLPFFIFPEGRSAVGGIPLLWFGLMTIAWSVLFAWVYVNTESILMPVLFHAAVNTALGTLGVLGRTNGSLTSVILNTALTWIVVVIIVAFTGKNLDTNKKSSLR